MSNNTRTEKEKKYVHVYLAVKRKKENPGITCKDEICLRQAVYDEETDLRVLKAKMQGKPGVWRIYKTVNIRNVAKAKKIMLHWVIDGLYQDSKWDSVFTKALLQKECRATKLALVDIDSKNMDEVEAVMKSVANMLEVTGVSTWELVATPNGFHLICDPFDKRILDKFEYADVDYDKFVFVERLTVEEKV